MVKKPRALIVDDSIENLKLLSLFLNKLGFEVTEIDDGQNAVEACTKETFDVIFMDLHMPFLNGIESAKMIRLKYGKNPDTTIIGVTADLSFDFKNKGLKNGFDDWLHKPITLNIIKKALIKQNLIEAS